MAVDPSGKFAYVANLSSGNVSAFAIDASSGALTAVGTVAAQNRPNSVAIHPTGRFVYVSNGLSNNISAYTVAAAGHWRQCRRGGGNRHGAALGGDASFRRIPVCRQPGQRKCAAL